MSRYAIVGLIITAIGLGALILTRGSRPSSSGSARSAEQSNVPAISLKTTQRKDGAGQRRLRVRCRDENSRLADHVLVFLRKIVDDTGLSLISRSDVEWSTVDVSPGTFRIEIVRSAAQSDPVPFEVADSLPFEFTVKSDEDVDIDVRVRPIRFPKVVIQASIQFDRPKSTTRIMHFKVRCRGATVEMKEVEPGRFRGEYEFRIATPIELDHPARVEIEGHGFSDQRFNVAIPEGQDVHLSFSRTIPTFNDTLQCALVDGETGIGIENFSLQLSVRQSLTNTSTTLVDVQTGPNGEFKLVDVSFPCAIFVPPRGGSERFVPDPVQILVVDRPDRLAFIRRWIVPEFSLRFDPEIRPSIVDAMTASDAWLEILPLTRLRERYRLEWGVGKSLNSNAASVVEDTGELPLGFLPPGRYRLTLVIAKVGVFTREFDADSELGKTVLDVKLDMSGGRLEIAETAGLGKPGIIIDGYVPFTLAKVISMTIATNPDAHSSSRILSQFAANAPAILASHSPSQAHVTVITVDDEVRHFRKPAGASLTANADVAVDPSDQLVTGRVIDQAGNPIAGAVVNLTSVMGGEELDFQPMPMTCEMRDVRTAPDGSFVIYGVTPGTYVFSVAEIVRSNEGRTREFKYATSSLKLVSIPSGDNCVIPSAIDELGEECGCGLRHLTRVHQHQR